MHRSVVVFGIVLAIFWNSGCSSPHMTAPPAVPVKGKVNLDGKPMPTGEIQFSVPGFPPKIIPIKDGAFSGEASIGKNQVEVVNMKEVGFSDTEPKTAIKVNTIADQFSGSKTTLGAEVAKGAANDFTFDVTSK